MASKYSLTGQTPSGAVAKGILEEVLRAMQNAEELGGPEEQDYLDLMDAIAAEAKQRRDNYAEILGKTE